MGITHYSLNSSIKKTKCPFQFLNEAITSNRKTSKDSDLAQKFLENQSHITI